MTEQLDDVTVFGEPDGKLRIFQCDANWEIVGEPVAEYDTIEEALKRRWRLDRRERVQVPGRKYLRKTEGVAAKAKGEAVTMANSNLDRVRSLIRALLAKTVANGCTDEEVAKTQRATSASTWMIGAGNKRNIFARFLTRRRSRSRSRSRY